MGHDVVMTPTTYVYLDYEQGEETIEPPVYADLRLTNATVLIRSWRSGCKVYSWGPGNLWTETGSHPASCRILWPGHVVGPWQKILVAGCFEKLGQFHTTCLRNNSIVLIEEGVNYSNCNLWCNYKCYENGEGKITLNLDSEVPGLYIYIPRRRYAKHLFPEISKPVELPERPCNSKVVNTAMETNRPSYHTDAWTTEKEAWQKGLIKLKNENDWTIKKITDLFQ